MRYSQTPPVVFFFGAFSFMQTLNSCSWIRIAWNYKEKKLWPLLDSLALQWHCNDWQTNYFKALIYIRFVMFFFSQQIFEAIKSLPILNIYLYAANVRKNVDIYFVIVVLILRYRIYIYITNSCIFSPFQNIKI